MDKDARDGANDSEQNKQLRNIARLVDDHYELEKKYIQVLSELDLLKKQLKNLNHDIQSPIGGITGMIDLLIDESTGKINVQSSDLTMIKESAKSILHLVYGTFSAEHLKKNPIENSRGDRLLSSAMMEINHLYLPMAQNKSISLSMRTQIDKEIQLQPNFYTNLIRISGNLVANAIKFTPSKGSVDVVFTLNVVDNHSFLIISVSDTGENMSPGQIKSFDQGKPVARSRGTNGEKSVGIGLHHVKKMVSEENGHIEVTSEKGNGTLFFISFPLPATRFPRLSTSHLIVENGTISHNGHQS